MGGGSGGHVTPIAATLKALKIRPDDEVRLWCDASFYPQAKHMMQRVGAPVRVDTIASGKFRRYSSLSMMQHILRVRTIVLPNIIDSLKIMAGVVQSFVKLIIWRPDVVFSKGGFVALPVGVAAHVLRIPIVIHDSDAHPGLTNRVLSKWATRIATGATLDHYTYSDKIAKYIGIPIDSRYRAYTSEEQRALKEKHGFSTSRPLTVITGGGLGAETINNAIVAHAKRLIKTTQVILISGKSHYKKLHELLPDDINNHGFILLDFVQDEMPEFLAAADLIVSRAGATTLLEIAALEKPLVLVPNPYLTGAHQIKNAHEYEKVNAAVTVREKDVVKDSSVLVDTIEKVLGDAEQQLALGSAIASLARPDAAREMATMIRAVGSRAK